MGVSTAVVEVAGADAQDPPSSIGVVTLDWPDKRNALGPGEAHELRIALERTGSSGVVGVILTGNGAFCAGGDLEALTSLLADPDLDIGAVIYEEFQGVVRTLLDIPVPTVAAIDGPAVGLGFDLTLACDLRLFGPKGWVLQGWARLGLIPGTGGIQLLQHIAPALVWPMVADQARIAGPAAEVAGLGQAVADHSAVDESVAALGRLAGMGLDALEAYVRLSREWKRDGFEAHLTECARTQGQLLRGAVFEQRAKELLSRST
jgi:enoyl-CoA hydratase/carnithine racemase